MIRRQFLNMAEVEPDGSRVVRLKWSDVLESAFDYYYTEYPRVDAESDAAQQFRRQALHIETKQRLGELGEDRADEQADIATLFDLLPDLPDDSTFWQLIKKLESEGVKEAEDHFWENIFTYRSVKELEVKGRKYRIEWEA